MVSKGKLIIFEGMECCGKGTQIKKLTEYLSSHDQPSVIAKEPGQTPAGQKIRELLLQTDFPIDPTTQMLLFNACRSDVYRHIVLPNLQQGNYVIQDRS
jgi:dTMP kinase